MEFGEKDKLEYIKEINLNNDWELNTVLPDTLFRINFFKGMKIYDQRIGEGIEIN